MLNQKENQKIIDDFDYLANAASSMDCTGLIPSLAKSEEELDSYNEVYQFRPPFIPVKKESSHP